jgi:CHAD domain-containing protein
MTRRREVAVALVVRQSFRASYERLVAHEAGLRSGEDPESLHPARVATRRLRSDLRTFAPFVERPWAADLSADLRWIGSELGDLRDIEVLRDRLRAHSAWLAPAEADAARRVVRRLDADREGARFDLLSMLAQPRYTHVREKLADGAGLPPFTDDAFAPASKALKKVVRSRFKKVRRAVRKAGEHPSDEALHRIRVRAKRCRYAAEACESVYGKRARRLARAMAEVQDVLGEHHDAVVATAWLAKTAHECSPTEAFAIGMLAQIEHGCAATARAEFRVLWRRVDTDRVRGWL